MEDILHIAISEFLHFGFKSVTVDDIAHKCGISKKTLYEHFSNKDELVLESVKQHTNSKWDEMLQITNKSKNAVEELVGFFAQMAHMFKKMNPTCFLDLERYYKNAYNYMEDFKTQKLLGTLKNNLARGIDEGYFRSDIDIDIVAQYRMESVFMMIHKNAFSHSPQSMLFINKQIFEVYMYGIATLKGHKLILKYLSTIQQP